LKKRRRRCIIDSEDRRYGDLHHEAMLLGNMPEFTLVIAMKRAMKVLGHEHEYPEYRMEVKL